MNRLGRVVLVLGVFALIGIACSKEPDPATVHRDKGNQLLNAGKWKEAAEELGLSLQANPNQENREKLWEKKAYAHMQAGEMDKADESILKTVDFKPDMAKKAEVYRNLASMYLQRKDVEKTERYFLKAVEFEPNDDLSLAWLAEIYAQRGGTRTKNPAIPELLDKSFTYYDKVIALKPNFPNTYINKRIAIAKYMEHERTQIEAAEVQIKENAKDKAKVEELQAKVTQHKARIDEFQKQFDELTAKFKELRAAQQQAQAGAPAAQGGQAAPPPPAPEQAAPPPAPEQAAPAPAQPAQQ